MYTWILQAIKPAYISIPYCHGTSQLGVRLMCFTQPTPRYVTYPCRIVALYYGHPQTLCIATPYPTSLTVPCRISYLSILFLSHSRKMGLFNGLPCKLYIPSLYHVGSSNQLFSCLGHGPGPKPDHSSVISFEDKFYLSEFSLRYKF